MARPEDWVLDRDATPDRLPLVKAVLVLLRGSTVDQDGSPEDRDNTPHLDQFNACHATPAAAAVREVLPADVAAVQGGDHRPGCRGSGWGCYLVGLGYDLGLGLSSLGWGWWGLGSDRELRIVRGSVSGDLVGPGCPGTSLRPLRTACTWSLATSPRFDFLGAGLISL